MTSTLPVPARVLVLCTANVARSQIAEALLGAMGGDRVIAESAGAVPGVAPHPMAIEVLSERGIDWHGRRSKGIDAVGTTGWDLVITVCDDAREACPVMMGARMLHWGLPDPAGSGIEAFRAVADELERRIAALLTDVGGGAR